MDNEGLEQLAKWFFMPPMKRYLVSIGRRGVASMDHDTQVNSCIVELAERTDTSIAELQNMDVSNLMQVAAKESTKYVPYIPAEANDAGNLPGSGGGGGGGGGGDGDDDDGGDEEEEEGESDDV
jgi:hypothetical protein